MNPQGDWRCPDRDPTPPDPEEESRHDRADRLEREAIAAERERQEYERERWADLRRGLK